MTVAALIAAYEWDETGLRATHPLAGVTLVEHQARRLAAAGARRILLLLEDWPPALAAPLARLRADGLLVETATSLADAAERLASEPRLLLLADGCLPDRALLDRIAQAPMPSLATLPDAPGNTIFERIDADERWAGIALIDGARVAEAAAMIGDWDAVSTLLRRAVQEGAGRIAVGAEAPVQAAAPGALHEAEARLVSGSRAAARNWAGRYIEAPLAEALLPQLFARAIEPAWPAAAATLLTLAGGLAALTGWRWPALAALLIAGPLARMATRLTLIQARTLRWEAALRWARLGGATLALAGLAAELSASDGQWGWWPIALIIPLGLAGIGAQRRILRWLGDGDAPLWLAGTAAMPWTLLPFAAVGSWRAGLAALAAYTLGSIGWVTWRALKLAR